MIQMCRQAFRRALCGAAYQQYRFAMTQNGTRARFRSSRSDIVDKKIRMAALPSGMKERGYHKQIQAGADDYISSDTAYNYGENYI